MLKLLIRMDLFEITLLILFSIFIRIISKLLILSHYSESNRKTLIQLN